MGPEGGTVEMKKEESHANPFGDDDSVMEEDGNGNVSEDMDTITRSQVSGAASSVVVLRNDSTQFPLPSAQYCSEPIDGANDTHLHSRKRVRTSDVLADVDKKFLLEQYVAERHQTLSASLQNRVNQLENELKEKERINLESLGLAETHHRENVLTEIGRMMEIEFSCSICNEVFIDPAVLNCGHTYCNYCINRALESDFLCPICRTAYNFQPPAKNVEMRNFINKLFQMMPEEMRTARDQAVKERVEMPPRNRGLELPNRRRRASSPMSPFSFLSLLQDDPFPLRRSRSRTRSITLSDSSESEDSVASLLFSTRRNRHSSIVEDDTHRARSRSMSPTSTPDQIESEGRRGSSPSFRGMDTLPSPPWRSGSPEESWWDRDTSIPRGNSQLSRVSPSPLRERRPINVARRGRLRISRTSLLGAVRPRQWGPRRQEDANRNAAGISSSARDAGNRRQATRPSYRPQPISLTIRPRVWGFHDPERDRQLSGSGMSSTSVPPVSRPVPRFVQRPPPLSDNFENLFSRRDPSPSVSSSPSIDASPTRSSSSQPLQHDHSYISSHTHVSSSSGPSAVNATEAQSNEVGVSPSVPNDMTPSRQCEGNCTLSSPTLILNSNNDRATSAVATTRSNASHEPRRSPRLARFHNRFLNGSAFDLGSSVSFRDLFRRSEDNRDRQFLRQDSQSALRSLRQTNFIGGVDISAIPPPPPPPPRNHRAIQDDFILSDLPDADPTTSRSIAGTTETSTVSDPRRLLPFEDRLVALRNFVSDLHNYNRSGPESPNTHSHRCNRRPGSGGNGRSATDRDNSTESRGAMDYPF